jgi:sulfate permease, SulP family
MTLYGMDAAMIAGFLSALFTFVAQNMTYIDPIRGTMSAATLRSDKRNRHHEARALLEDLDIGRSRIMVIQFQGHLFFGNIGNVTNRISNLLSSKFETVGQPIIIIIDFSLVLGIDSSAAQAITKLKTLMHKQYQVELSIFVTGSEHGFPCAFDLSKELMEKVHNANEWLVVDETSFLMEIPQNVTSSDAVYERCNISEDLNSALIHAENYLIARQNPELLVESLPPNKNKALFLAPNSTWEEEYEVAIFFLMNLTSADQALVKCLFSNYVREKYVKGDVLWKQGDPSSSVTLVIRGMLMSTLEMEAGTVESVSIGNSIGELGFIEGSQRMSTVTCWSDDAIVYSMSRESYDRLLLHHPHSARLLDIICIRYLSARVQHVSNRIFETRCLPI